MAQVVEHDEAAGIFSIAVPGGERGMLEYHRETSSSGDVIIDITHTVVPAAARGLGTAKKLSDAAFAFARSVGASVRPSCTYIKDTYLAKNADGKSFTFNERENLVRLH